MTTVSRNPVQDHQSKTDPADWKPVGLARISYGDNGSAMCSCGWSFFHIRAKVLEDGVDRHLAKRHGSRGLRF